jgi:homoserine O-acetyltransferase
LGKSVGIVESKIFHCKDELALVCGKKLSEFDLIYETYGKLNITKQMLSLFLMPYQGITT